MFVHPDMLLGVDQFGISSLVPPPDVSIAGPAGRSDYVGLHLASVEQDAIGGIVRPLSLSASNRERVPSRRGAGRVAPVRDRATPADSSYGSYHEVVSELGG